MISYPYLYEQLEENNLSEWISSLKTLLQTKLIETNNGNYPKWLQSFSQLPDFNPSSVILTEDTITVGHISDISNIERDELQQLLRNFMPWRKGPYRLFDIFIDTEWRSDWKWQRLLPHISRLENKTILDVGCGNGYHSWRMRGAGAKLVVGIDPSLLFVMQYQAVNKYIKDKQTFVLPLKLEDMPRKLPYFDTIFSMGVLYHRRSPLDHLQHLFYLLKPGGELILETLIVRSQGENNLLIPKDRYAKMNNVWFIPSPEIILTFLSRSGFSNARVVDINQTSTQEQRATDWMRFESLKNFLNPEDSNLTIEGYPAPIRAIFVANKPQ